MRESPSRQNDFMIATISGLLAWIITLALRAAFGGCLRCEALVLPASKVRLHDLPVCRFRKALKLEFQSLFVLGSGIPSFKLEDGPTSVWGWLTSPARSAKLLATQAHTMSGAL
jgi:hypothetical protein